MGYADSCVAGVCLLRAPSSKTTSNARKSRNNSGCFLCHIHPNSFGLSLLSEFPPISRFQMQIALRRVNPKIYLSCDLIFDGIIDHISRLFRASALSLLVLRVFTDDPDLTLSLNDFALIADRFYRRSYFHFFLLLLKQTAIYFTTEGAKIQ